MENSNKLPGVFKTLEDQTSQKTEQQSGLDRRKFFKLFGSGLAVAFVLPNLVSFAKRISSNKAPPKPCTIDPIIWFSKCSGFTIAPHSKA